MSLSGPAVARVSYAAGPTDPPVPNRTIGDWLAVVAQQDPEREALVISWQNIRWSWRDLDRRVEKLERGFVRLGLQRGDRVGIWSPNCAEWVLTQLASARRGLVLVPINPAYRTAELGHALRLAGVRALVTANRFRTSDYVGMLAELMPASADDTPAPLFGLGLPDLRFVIEIGGSTAPARIGFDELMDASGDEPLAQLSLSPDDAINIQFTSGTTGSPKGATLSHRNILHNAVVAAAGMRLCADDRLCIPVPLYHCFGMVLGVLVCLVTRATMVFPAQSFDPAHVLANIERESCTALHGVPTMFLSLLNHPDFAKFDLSSLRTGIAAGALCPPAMMRRMMNDMHLVDITIGYGMTETSPLSTQTSIDADLETRTETVGRMLPHMEGKIVDETGTPVPLNQSGEYCSRGPGLMLGYWNQAEATTAAIHDGWMHSGDLATMDAQGCIRIVGRIKDMIIRGGENIYPAEIEAFLTRHPRVAEAHVFGIPDERLGEQVCAWVRVHKPLEGEELLAWCRGLIAHHKVPALVRIVDSFPMTATGKVQKFVMREVQMRRSRE